jgi:hypothetical protein
MIENISVMDKPVEKGKGLSRGMWIAVIGESWRSRRSS